MTRILFVINTMGMGGAERAMLELMNALPAEAELSLLALVNRGELFREVPARVRILNCRPDPGPLLGAGGRAALAKVAARALLHRGAFVRRLPALVQNAREQRRAGRVQPDKLLWRLLAEATPPRPEAYDLAVAFLEGGATYYVADRVQARRKVAFVHIDYPSAGYTRRMDADAYDRMNRIYAVSGETARRFLCVHAEQAAKVRVFENLVDAERIRRLAETGEGFTDGFSGARLLTIGRLHPQKGYDIAIPAMKKLVERGCDARWYVLGEGMERPALERMIRALGLEERFVLLGARANPYPYLKQADLYVHATRFEGKSIAIEEARVLRKPIIATDCPGNREQIRSGVDGLLVTLSVDSLADALEAALREPERMRAYAEAIEPTADSGGAEALYAFAKGED